MYNHSSGEAETGRSPRLTVSQPHMISKLNILAPDQWETLRNKPEVDVWPPHLCAQVCCAPMHTHSQTKLK